MILNYLKLQNYRRFRDLSLDLPGGVVGIVGDNGSGKTTLVEAIAWALYGSVAARSGREEIRSYGSPLGSSCLAELSFEFSGDSYLVRRELKGISPQSRLTSAGGEQTRATIHVNGKLAAKGVRAARDYVQNLLGMDYPAFQISFYARQRELNALSDLRPADRKTQMVKMLGIDTVDKAISLLRSDRRGLSERLEYARQQLPDLDEIRERKRERESKLQETKERIGATRSRAEERREKLKKLQEDFGQLASKREKAHSLEKSIEVLTHQERNLQGELAEIEKEISRIETLRGKLQTLEGVSLELKEIQERLKSYEKARIQIEYREKSERELEKLAQSLKEDREGLSRLKEVSPRIEKLKSQKEQLEGKIGERDKELEQLRSQLTDLKGVAKSKMDEKKRLLDQLEAIERLGPESRCDRCLRPLGKDFEEIRSHISGEMGTLEEEIRELSQKEREVTTGGITLKNAKSSLESELQSCQRELESFSRQLGRLESLQRGMEEKQKRLHSLQESLKELAEVRYDSEEHRGLEVKLKELELKREEYIRTRQEVSQQAKLTERRESLAGQKDSVTEKINSNRRELEELDFRDSTYQEVSSQREGAVEESHQLELLLKDQESRHEILKSELENLREQLANGERLQEETKRLQKEVSLLHGLDRIFGDLRTELISRIRPSLSELSGELLSEMTDGRYRGMELDEDYNILIYDGVDRFGIERFSGGEKDLANLCLRLAISQSTSESHDFHFSFIILDEIFGSQDSLRKENIVEALSNLKNRFQQIFLITHVEEIKDRVDNLILVKEDTSGTSQAVLV
jgi:exonuclease SbcC